MKIFNKIASALMVLPVVAALTACSDDDKYTPAELLTNAQVYFSNQLPANVALVTEGEGVVNVQLNRVKTDEELTVNLVATQPEEQTLKFNVPASVTFAEGESTASIDVTYDPSQVEYDTKYMCQLAISDEEYTTPYGQTAYTFTGSIAAPWKSLGMATFTENCMSAMYEMETITYQVEIQENETKPGFYRLVNPYGAAYPYNEDGDWDDSQDYYLEIHAEDPDFVYMPLQYLGINWGNGELGLMDFAYYNMLQGATAEALKAAGMGGTLKDGIITWAADGLLIHFKGGSSLYYGNRSGEFEIVLPGYTKADYSVSAAFAGILTTAESESQAVVDFTKGPDVATAKYALTPSTVSAAVVADAIVAGELEAVELSDESRVYIPVEEDGTYRVTIVGLDAEGELKSTASVVFEFAKGGSLWESLGMGVYTDDFMTYGYFDKENDYAWVPFYDGLEPQTYEVEVMAHTQKPGLYRLKNAYGEAYPLNDEGDWDASMDYYLVIDAQDPEYVMIDNQELGLNWNNLGMVSVESDGSYYVNKYSMTPADIVAALVSQGGDDPFGKFVDGVITFPADAFGVYVGEDGFCGNHNGAFKLVLPEAVSESDVKAAKFASRLRKYSRLSKQASKNAGIHSQKLYKGIKNLSRNAKKFNGKVLK